MYFVCSAYLSIKSPAVLRYSQQGWHPNDFSLPKACLQCVSSIWNLPSDCLRLEGHAHSAVLFSVSAPGHHLYRPCFPSPWPCMKALSADTQRAGLSDLKLSELRTEFLLVSTLHQLWPQQFALPWPVLKAVKIRDTCCIGDHLQHCLFFFFSFDWFSLVFCCIFDTWRFCWALALQGWDPAGTREQCISSWASSASQAA